MSQGQNTFTLVSLSLWLWYSYSPGYCSFVYLHSLMNSYNIPLRYRGSTAIHILWVVLKQSKRRDAFWKIIMFFSFALHDFEHLDLWGQDSNRTPNSLSLLFLNDWLGSWVTKTDVAGGPSWFDKSLQSWLVQLFPHQSVDRTSYLCNNIRLGLLWL